MQSTELKDLVVLIGEWDLVMSNAWFRENLEEEVKGFASFEWLDDGFVVLRMSINAEPPSATFVIGLSDPQQRFEVLYHDERGVSRIFEMDFDGKEWKLNREDDDMYQRLFATIDGDVITSSWEASDDQAKTWRKDFDLRFTRR